LREGIDYALARWQDPETGRFTSLDPIKAGINWYVYCGNNPLSFIDPTGLDYSSYGEAFGYNYNNFEAATTGEYNPSDPAGITSNMTDYGWGVYLNNELTRSFIKSLAASVAFEKGKISKKNRDEERSEFEQMEKKYGLKERTDVGILMCMSVERLLAGDDSYAARELITRAVFVAYTPQMKNAIGDLVNQAERGMAYIGDKVAAATEKAAAGREVREYGPLNKGPLGEDIANTFRSGKYTELTTESPTTLYRVIGPDGNPAGAFWSRTEPAGQTQTIIDSALDPTWGNTATIKVTATIPAGTTIYEGTAAAQGGLVGGGNQVYVPNFNPSWINGKTEF
jgi:hypothetical protein